MADKEKLIKEWEVESKVYNDARAKRGFKYVSADDLDHYNRSIAEAMEKLALPSVPGMPVFSNKLSKAKLRKLLRRNKGFSHILLNFKFNYHSGDA